MRKLSLILVLLTLVFAPAFSRGDEAPVTVEQFNQRLDRLRVTLEEVEKSLTEANLTDATLRRLRERLEPLPREFEDTIEKLAPRLASIDARLKELGAAAEAKPAPAPAPEQKPLEQKPAAKPADGKGGPRPSPENKADASKTPAPPPPSDAETAAAAVKAEIEEQRKRHDEIDATIKRARGLLVETRQLSVAIVARQRALFARTIFLRSSGLFSPGLWRAARREAPAVVDASSTFLTDRASNFIARASGPRRGEFLGIIALILLSVPPALYLARRVLRRSDDKKPGSATRRAAAAGWTALVTAAVPVAAVAALGLTFESFDLLDAMLEPLWRSVVEAVARVSFVFALTRAFFAPTHPQWRLIDPGDRLASLFVRAATAAAIVLSVTRLLEQLEETTQASLPVVIVTRGVGVMIVAALLARVILALPARAAVAEDAALATPQGRDWIAVTRFLGVVTLLVIVGACATGYVTFANFVILQIGWMASVGALLYLFVTIAGGGVEAAFAPDGLLGRGLVSGLGLRREQLAPMGVVLSGLATLAAFAVAFVVALAPLGFESGDLFGNLRTAFFSFKIGDVTISPSSALGAILIFAVVLTLAQAFRRWLDTRLLPLTRLDVGFRNSIGATLGYAGFILAAGLALSHIGLGFEKLAIVAGALSVGIGFGLQSIVNNFVSGLILLWERAIRVGDWVVVGDEQGYVKRINVRSTEIETFDRATMIVPNSNLVAGVVKNWLRGDKVGRIKIALAPHSGVDPEQMRDILLAVARAQEGVLRIPAPQVMFLGIDGATFKFELWCYVEDVEKSARVRSDLHFDLHRALADAGISMAAAVQPAAPTIVQIPELDKLAAAAAASILAVEAGVGQTASAEELYGAQQTAQADDAVPTAQREEASASESAQS